MSSIRIASLSAVAGSLVILATIAFWGQSPLQASANLPSNLSLQAAIDVGTDLELPCGVTVLTSGLTVRTGNRHISGAGPCTVLNFVGTRLEYAIAIAASNVELDHLTISAAPGVLCRGVSMGNVSHVSVHDLTISGAGTVSPQAGLPAAIRFLNVTDLVLRDNDISGSGPATGNAGGYDILSDSGASRRISVARNRIHGSNSTICIALFNVDDVTVENNFIDQSHAFDHSKAEDAGQGYGIVLYGAGQRTIDTGPSGLVRSRNVVVMKTKTAHSFSVGQHIVINQATSTGGTDFNRDFNVSSAPTSTTLTFAQEGPDDNGGGGVVNPSFSSARVAMNTVTNTAGSGIYLQAYTDSVVEGNVITAFGQLMQDTSLPEGGIALMSPMRVIVRDNFIDGSVQNGIAFAAGHAVTITDNVIGHVKYGVQVRGVNQDVHIRGNIVRGVALGISLPPSAPANVFEVVDNTIREGNTSSLKIGSQPKGSNSSE
jgi:putative cofactor-binding repeat protein